MPSCDFKMKVDSDCNVHLEDFQLLKVLGKGAYGKVFQARKLRGSHNGNLFAIKSVNKSRIIIYISIWFFPFLGSKHQTRDELAMVLSLPCNEIENGASEIYFGKYKIAHELMKVY